MATYIIINVIVMASLIPAMIRLRHTVNRSWWLALLILVAMTAIFDNVIVGLNIVGYDQAKILGLRVGIAPIEDFFYAIAAMIIVATLWERNE